MSSQPPAHSQPPQHGKDPWRLRGVHRAEPHLGEGDRSPRIVWAIVAALVLLLIIIVAVMFFQSGVAATVPTASRTPSPISSTPSSSNTRANTPPPSASTNTPAPFTSTATPPRPTAAIVRYRVRAGDTLSEIAQKFNVSVRAIMQANGLRNETIIEGEELIIPSATPRP